MAINEHRGCLICRSGKYETVFTYDKPDRYERAVGIGSAGYWRKWVRCMDCGFYYSLYSRRDDAIDRLYAFTYRSEASSWRENNVEDVFERIISLPPEKSETKCRVQWIKSQLELLWASGMVEKGSPPYRLLDIGGATGVMAYEFRDHEWRTQIIDPSEQGTFVQTKYGIPYVKDYYKPGCFEEPFELITLCYVVEHLRDPVSFLKLIRADMRPHSLVFLEVPDAAHFTHRSQEDDIFNSCHLWMFSPGTLIALLDLCGFEAFSMVRTKTVRGIHSLMVIGGLK